MGKKTTEPTAAELALLEEGWKELGESIAATVVDGGKSLKWAWELVGPLGLYKHWMLIEWIERYKAEGDQKRNEAEIRTPNRPGRKPKPKSLFTKRDQINEALRLLNEGQNPLDCLQTQSTNKQNG